MEYYLAIKRNKLFLSETTWINLFFKNLSIVDLQCFRCTTKWFSYMCLCIYIYTHTLLYLYINVYIYICIYVFFFSFFPIQVITRCWIQFPILYSRSLLFIYFIYSNMYPLIPNFQFISLLLSFLATISSFSMSMSLFHVYHFFRCHM